MSNFMTIPLFILATYIYLFSFWKSIREEAPQTAIFVSELGIIGLSVLVGVVGLTIPSLFAARNIFNPSHVWFQLAFVGLVLGVGVVSKYLHLSFAIVSEAVLPGVLAILFILSLSDPVGMALIAASTIVFTILHKTYKRIGWYKSGRPGFASYATIGLLFIARIVFALSGHPVLFSIGQVDILFSSIVAFLSFFLIYNQSGL